MGLKKVPVVDTNKVTLSTQTENWLFNRICEERSQNKDLKRTINDLKGQIDNQQELLKYLAENLTNKDANTTDEASSPSGNDSIDGECSSSDREEAEPEKTVKKRKLSDSADQSDQDGDSSQQ